MNARTTYPVYPLDFTPSVAPQQLAFQGGCIDLWAMPLAEDDACWQTLQATLSCDEQERAARFQAAAARREFVFARGTLRVLLARYLNMQPADLRFAYMPNGKPYLIPAPGAARPLQFNLSHTNGLVMYAIGWGCALGLDIEQVRAEWADAPTAQQFMTAAEFRAWQRLPAAQQTAAYFHLWTCKEAYLKTSGAGFAVAPETIDIALSPDALPQQITVPQSPESWAFYQFTPLPGYAGALGLCASKQAAARPQ